MKWKNFKEEKPPYFEMVQVIMTAFHQMPFSHGALIPGTCFCEFGYHEDIWVDDTLTDEYFTTKDIWKWRHLEMESGVNPTVKFIDGDGYYDFELEWSHDMETTPKA